MKILLSSYVFPPSVGGIETLSLLFAHKFKELGHELKIATETVEQSEVDKKFEIYRRAGFFKLRELYNWCDVALFNNISLKLNFPAIFTSCKTINSIHTWIHTTGAEATWQNKLKQKILKKDQTISISAAIANHLNTPSIIIPNPYQEDKYFLDEKINKTNDLIFAGRLVKDKGCDVLIKALVHLHKTNFYPNLRIIGEGEEQENLSQLINENNLSHQIEFMGQLKPEELNTQYSESNILVVPSVWEEPFGLVALEAIACGCVVIASNCGGLPDAVGPCGLFFTKGDDVELSLRIRELLESPQRVRSLLTHRDEHLSKHKPDHVAKRYLDVLQSACNQ